MFTLYDFIALLLKKIYTRKGLYKGKPTKQMHWFLTKISGHSHNYAGCIENNTCNLDKKLYYVCSVYQRRENKEK